MPRTLALLLSGAAVVWGCKKGEPDGAKPVAAEPLAVPTCPVDTTCCGRLPVACPTGFDCTKHGTCESATTVLVPASPFWMGCNQAVDRACEEDEQPQHLVRVPAFVLQRHEVTRAEYRVCVEAGQCTPPRGPGKPQPVPKAPVTMVDWHQAARYCAFVGGRLPTEAEWEKAARGGCELWPGDCRHRIAIYPWGNGSPTCTEVASGERCDAAIGEVGGRPSGRSPYGALDMAGSVWEWVEDCSHADYRGAPDDGTAWTTPCESNVRIDRGGRNGDAHSTLRASNRSDEHANNPVETVGVRCAFSVGR